MRIITLLLALGLTRAGALEADQARAGFVATETGEAPSAVAPEAWSQEDPADSLYREARAAMNQGEHGRAARLFRQIWNDHPRSNYAPDAPYWEAFNRYRTDETRELERALESLDEQRRRYEDAQTRTNGDATSLAARIRGKLARRGDESSARAVVAAGQIAASMPTAEMVAAAEEMAYRAQEMVSSGQIEMMAAQAAAMGERVAAVAEGAAMGAAWGLRSGRQNVPPECRDQVEMALAALNALTHMSADRAMPVLKQVMDRRDECAPPIRRRAVFLIADKRTDESVDILLEAARNDPDLEVRRQAVFWLSEVDDPRAIEALEQFLFQSEDEQIRERAVFALSQHRDPRARQVLRRVIQDEDMPTRVRSRALFWLGESGTSDDIAFIRGLFDRTRDPEIQEAIIRAVALQENPDNAAWLLRVGSNPQVALDARRHAIFWAAEAGAGADELAALYDSLQDRKLKERVLFALSETDTDAGIDKLIEIARTEEDIELRKKAIFWLSNTDDPRATELLMELLTGGGGGGGGGSGGSAGGAGGAGGAGSAAGGGR